MSLQANGVILNGGQDRPGEPESWSKSSTKGPKWHWNAFPPPVPSNHQLPLTFHHTIGWQMIWKCWNHLVSNNLWETIAPWAYLLGVTDAEIKGMKGNNLPNRDDVCEEICWSKWNMVEGPSHRSDDPSKSKDDLDLFTVGASNNVRSRMQQLSSLFTMMKALLLVAKPTAKDAANLKRQLEMMRSLKNSDIAWFSEDMWELVDAGKYDQYGNVVNDKHAVWKKKSA